MLEQIKLFLLNPWNLSVIILGVVYSLFSLWRKNESLIQYIPHVWTALGVLGTFIALYLNLGLKALPMNIDPITGENIINIKELIKNLTNAFSTSIIGITGSVLSSFIIKVLFDHKKASSIKQPWEEKDERELLYELIKVFKSSQKTNEFIFNSVDTNIKDIKGNIMGNISDLINKFEQSIEDHLKQIGKETLSNSVNLMDEFNKNFENHLKKLLANNNTLLTESIKQSEQKLADVTGLVEQNVTRAMNNFSDAVNKFQDSTDNMNKAIASYVETAKEGFNQVSNDFMETAFTIKQETTSSMKDFNIQLNSVTEKYKESLENLNDKIVKETSKLLADNLAKLENSFEKLEKYQINSQILLEQTTDQFRQTVDNYNEINKDEANYLSLLKEHIEYTKNLISDRKKILDSLSEVSDLLPDLSEYIKTVNHLIDGRQIERTIPSNTFDNIKINGN